MKTVIEAHRVDGVKVCRSEEVHVCASCGYDLDEAELAADTCSDCGAPLKLRKSVSVWATSVPKAGAKTWGQQQMVVSFIDLSNNFSIAVVDNFYSVSELEEIQSELKLLSAVAELKVFVNTEPAKDEQGNLKQKNNSFK